MKLNVGVIFGGKSLEHEKGIITACEVMSNLDQNKYNIVPIYIDKDNNWYTGYHLKDILNYRDIALVKRYAKKVVLIKQGCNFILQRCNLLKRNVSYVDLVIPCGLGTYISDGILQGYLDMIGIPYAGSNTLSCAVSKDKVIIKDLVRANNIPTTNYIWFYSKEFVNNRKKVLEQIKDLKYPLCCKPAKLGSSIGVSLVNNEEELIKEIKNIIKYDDKVIVEEKIKNTKEISISVLGDFLNQETSDIYEEEYYDEEIDRFTKVKEHLNNEYNKLFKINLVNKKTKPLISKEMKEDIKSYAKEIFRTINAKGVIQVDFLIDERNMKLYFSKINAVPYCMSSQMWKKSKKSETELLDDLIKIAIERYKGKNDYIRNTNNNLLEEYDLKIK